MRRRSAPTSLATILERHGERLRADAIVLADSTNWAIGEPALTTTLRGMIRVVVTVTTLDHGVHSGMFGGAVPDALTALIRVLASLHDDDGNVVVAGLKEGVASDLDYSEDRLRAESGLLDGVSTIGSGSLLSRIWTKPSATTIGIDAPSVATSSNTLVPSASAKVSIRLAPDELDLEAFELVKAHLLAHAPWGAKVEVTLDDRGLGFAADARGPVYDEARAAFRDAWGVEPVDIGVGRVDPVRRGVRRAVPRGRDPRHRCRGPRRAGPRRQRVAAPGRVREGLPRRGAAAGPSGGAHGLKRSGR